MRLVAKTKCQFRGRIYEKGETCEYGGEVTAVYPPREYFAFPDEEAPKKKEDEPDPEQDKDNKDKLRDALDKAGIPYDQRWGVTKLRNELINGSKGL